MPDLRSAVDDRLLWLGIADFNYLSSRLLMLTGLGPDGYSKGAEAIEKAMKVLLLLIKKITNNTEMNNAEIRKNVHKLIPLLDELVKIEGSPFTSDWYPFFKDLEKVYQLRYPDNWEKNLEINMDLEKIDQAYIFIRNCAVINFPAAEKGLSQIFGTVLYSSYSPIFKKQQLRNNMLTVKYILQHNNRDYDKLLISSINE